MPPRDTTTAEPPEPRLRRIPQQARARARIEHVLRTADGVLASEGADALTTTRIAEAAGISVGSLYQWFPDKAAIAEALAFRYAGEFIRVTEALTAAEEAAPSGDPVGAMLDAFAQAFRERPGFRALWFGGARTEELRDATRPALAEIAALATRALAANRPDSPPELVGRVAAMSVQVADALLRQAFRIDPDGDPALLAETRVLLTGYVEGRLEGAPQPDPPVQRGARA